MKHCKWKTYDSISILDPNFVQLSVGQLIEQHNALFDHMTECELLIKNLRTERDRLVILSRENDGV